MRIIKLSALVLSIAAFQPATFAQLNIPSDGSDGPLIVSNSILIDLTKAVAGNWTNNNSANMGNGIYDSNQWAVVFKYSSIFITNGAKVTFINNATHAPVVWLVQSNVTINGEVSLDGQDGTGNLSAPTEPGPGGFRGAVSDGATFGPGGNINTYGLYTSSYGNLQILPLIGGSGGEGSPSNGGGPSGGGAILIAASNTITISAGGYLHANGGNANHFFVNYSASGGAIRFIASQILGTGTLQANPGANGGDFGRIRLEATNASSLAVSPPVTVVSPFPVTIFPPTNAATVQILSISNSVIGLLPVPGDPQAAMTSSGDDLTIVTTNQVTIRLKTTNFPTNGTVNVFLNPRDGPHVTIPITSPVSGDSNAAIWQVTTSLPLNHTVIQARASY